MSEEIKRSVFDIFKQQTQTYEEACKKRDSEQLSKKIERFRVAEDGEYEVRVLPLAPYLDENDNPIEGKEVRKGYEYPVQQQFITIKTPAKGKKKAGKINIPVVRATQKGVDLPVDIIDEYVKIAKDYGEDIAEKIGKNSYSGGLKWNFQHAMYVLDVNKNRKGPLLYTCSGAQYHGIDEEKFSIWNQLRKSRPNRPDICPLCSFTNAYTLTIKRGNNNGKTEYKFSINALGEEDNLNESELNALVAAPRIPDEIYRYTRYQFEATLAFLQQYDEMLDIDVCAQEDFQTAVEQLRAALSKDDTSHFSMDSAGDSKDNKSKSTDITLDLLWDELDYIEEQGLDKTSDEYKELREKIGQYIQDHDLDMRVSHSKSNTQLLNDIEELEGNNAQTASKKEVEKPKEEAAPAPRKRQALVEEEETEEQPAEEEPKDEPEPEAEKEAEEGPVRRPRRQRPVDDDDEEESKPAETKEEEQPKEGAPESEEEEETPRRRRRLR